MLSVIPLLLSLSLPLLATSQSCHDYILITSRGSGEAQGPSIAFPGVINQTLSAIPDGATYNVVYPASTNASAYVGAADLVQYITSGLESCPEQSYAILAYSLGTRAAALGLANLTSAYPSIKAILAFGDEVRQPNRTADIDNLGGTSNRADPGRDLHTNGTVPFPEVFYDEGKLLDICYINDNVCDRYSKDQVDQIPHIQYGVDKMVQSIGAQFVISRLASNGTSLVGGNGTATATGTNGTIGGGNGTAGSGPSAAPSGQTTSVGSEGWRAPGWVAIAALTALLSLL